MKIILGCLTNTINNYIPLPQLAAIMAMTV